MLERTMGRASSTLSPGHRHFAVQVTLPLVYTLNSKDLFLDFQKTSAFLLLLCTHTHTHTQYEYLFVDIHVC